MTAMAVAMLGLSTGIADAQAEVLIEGRLLACDAQTRMINVMGIGVYVPAEATIFSPTRKLQFGELLGIPFPGRTEKGFLNGVAVVTASIIDGRNVATEISVLPDENVLLGPIHWVNGQFTLMGKPVKLIEDKRMFGKAVNAGGLPIDLSTALEGSQGAIDGYVSPDGTFYAYRIEADEAQIPAGTVATGISRARARSTDVLEVSGGTTAQTGVVRVRDADTGELIGDLVIQSGPIYGTYNGRLAVKKMPLRVQVTTLNNQSRCQSAVQQ
jgi:hypothetical protein